MRHRFPVLSRPATAVVAVGIVVICVLGHATPNPVKLARQAEAGMCADDHSLDMMQTHLIRDSIQSATVTEETVSSIEHLLNNARLRCGDRLNIADAQFLGGL